MSDIHIKVGFLGSLRGYVRRRDMDVTLPRGSTVGSLLEHLSQSLGEAFTSQVFNEDGTLSHQVSILMDGIGVKSSESLKTVLNGGSVDVMILPVYEGG